MLEAFILEDEPLVILECEMLLEELGVSLCGSSLSIPAAKKMLKTLKPDFLIVDIFVKDRMGFELIEYCNERNLPVIVITGIPKDSIYEKSRELKVASFLTKPLVPQVFKYEILKLQDQIKKEKKESFFFFTSKYKVIKILYADVIYIKSDGNYCEIHTVQKRHVIKKSLIKIQKEFNADLFVQISRGVILNISFISSMDLVTSNLSIDGLEFSIGRKYKSNLQQALKENYNIIGYSSQNDLN